MKNELMKKPKCPICGTETEYRVPGTKEQEYCGAWYECVAPRCVGTVLIPSKELQKLYGLS